MIDKELEIFEFVASRLRKKYPTIYVVGTEITDTPPRFPAVSIVQTNNAIKTRYSTFGSLENVVQEDYKAEVFSNLEKGKEKETKEIIKDISYCFTEQGYERTFCEPIPNGDTSISRRIARFTKNNVI